MGKIIETHLVVLFAKNGPHTYEVVHKIHITDKGLYVLEVCSSRSTDFFVVEKQFFEEVRERVPNSQKLIEQEGYF